MFNSKIGELFERRSVVSDVSGSGNNWRVRRGRRRQRRRHGAPRRAHGHNEYGPRYRDAIMERVRSAAEHCDSLQCFLMFHSLGGGTGSGLGTYVLGALQVGVHARVHSRMRPALD